MNHFLTLAIAAVCLSLALAQEHSDDHDNAPSKEIGDGYYSGPSYGGHRFGGSYGGPHGGRFGGRFGGYGGYGYKYKKCPDLEDPENGDVKVFGLTPKSTAVHYCTLGFNLIGEKVRTCQRDGTWTGDAPTCEPVDCGDPQPAGSNGARLVEGTTLKETASYSCNEGYLIDATDVGSEVIICLPSGLWSDVAPVCIPVNCQSPPEEDVNGGRSFTDTIYQSEVTYTCNEGYDLPGDVDSVVLTCQADATWSADAPVCTPVNCGPAPAPSANGIVDSDATTFTSTAVYSCNAGYLLDYSAGGSQQIECLSNGAWSGSPAFCDRIDCGYISVPLNGDIKYNADTRLDSTAEFSCDRRFRLVGEAVRTCEASGDWSLSSPSCERIVCTKLSAPKFGKVRTFSRFVDGKAQYSCSYGFSLLGDAVRECQEDGTWSGEDPTCKKNEKYGGYGRPYGGYGGSNHGGY